MHDSVTVHMTAPPQRIWELVSDVTRIGSYSPETFEAEWLGGATGPAEGAQFRGHVKRNGKGPTYWTTCTVLACTPGSEFTFGVGPGEPGTRSLTSHQATMPRPWSLRSRRSIAAICDSVVLPAGSACWFAYGRPALAGCRMCPIRPLCPVMPPLLMR